MRRLQIKFPSQIRISGWDFGSSARAMNQAGGFISTQADLRTVRKSTTERKSMSTKTTIKRIALVAVSALGFGMVSAVAPANAAAIAPTAVSVGTLPIAQVGVAAKIPVTVTAPYTAGGSDTHTINVVVISAPTGSALAGLATMGKLANGTSAGTFVAATYASGNNIGASMTWSAATGQAGNVGTSALSSSDSKTVGSVFTSAAYSTAPTTASFNLNFTADVAGSYKLMISTDNSTAVNLGTNEYAAGDAVQTVTITTGNSVASMAFTAVGSAPAAGGSNGQLFKLTLKDSAGAVTGPGSTETISVVPNQSTTTLSSYIAAGTQTHTATGTGGITLSSSDFAAGIAYIRVSDSTTTATSIVLTASGSGTLASTISATTSLTTVAYSSGTSVALSDVSGATRPGSGHVGFSSYADTANLTVASHSYALTDTVSCTAAATKKYLVTVTDTSGKLTGITGLARDWTVTGTCNAGGTAYVATVTVTGALGAASKSFTVVAGGSSTLTVTSATPAIKTFTAGPANVLKLATGGSVKLYGYAYDQFGDAVAAQAVTLSITGRNATAASVALATDANGYVSYTVTDASTSTTSLTDTVTFSATNASSQVSGDNVVTISYGAYTPATITVTGGNTTASVENATVTVNPIYAGDGAENGAVTFTATVKDANGALLAGVPVTFSVAGTGAAVKSTTKTVYTGSAGTAAASVYAWLAGTYTVTATAGAKSTTGTATFATTTATYARTVSASASGNVVTGKVVDRFGNPVQGVKLYAKTTAPASIGGLFVTNGTTASDGTVSFVVTGSGDVTISAVDPTAVAGTTYGQTCALAGNLTCAAGSTAATAFSAYVAGTDLEAEEYVGSSYAPAGVASATVSATDTTATDSVDAANEATDAANAATDAANAAAEAADAATAAAQDAQAAVAELATQVAALIAGIKAQITTLTNLVIKIQKKVKA